MQYNVPVEERQSLADVIAECIEAGECCCSLIGLHPHSSVNELCPACKAEFEAWLDAQAEEPENDWAGELPPEGPHRIIEEISPLELIELERQIEKEAA